MKLCSTFDLVGAALWYWHRWFITYIYNQSCDVLVIRRWFYPVPLLTWQHWSAAMIMLSWQQIRSVKISRQSWGSNGWSTCLVSCMAWLTKQGAINSHAPCTVIVLRNSSEVRLLVLLSGGLSLLISRYVLLLISWNKHSITILFKLTLTATAVTCHLESPLWCKSRVIPLLNPMSQLMCYSFVLGGESHTPQPTTSTKQPTHWTVRSLYTKQHFCECVYNGTAKICACGYFWLCVSAAFSRRSTWKAVRTAQYHYTQNFVTIL